MMAAEHGLKTTGTVLPTEESFSSADTPDPGFGFPKLPARATTSLDERTHVRRPPDMKEVLTPEQEVEFERTWGRAVITDRTTAWVAVSKPCLRVHLWSMVFGAAVTCGGLLCLLGFAANVRGMPHPYISVLLVSVAVGVMRVSWISLVRLLQARSED